MGRHTDASAVRREELPTCHILSDQIVIIPPQVVALSVILQKLFFLTLEDVEQSQRSLAIGTVLMCYDSDSKVTIQIFCTVLKGSFDRFHSCTSTARCL